MLQNAQVCRKQCLVKLLKTKKVTNLLRHFCENGRVFVHVFAYISCAWSCSVGELSVSTLRVPANTASVTCMTAEAPHISDNVDVWWKIPCVWTRENVGWTFFQVSCCTQFVSVFAVSVTVEIVSFFLSPCSDSELAASLHKAVGVTFCCSSYFFMYVECIDV